MSYFKKGYLQTHSGEVLGHLFQTPLDNPLVDNIYVKRFYVVNVNFLKRSYYKKTRDYFDATASNWNTSAHSAPWRVSV